MAESKRRTIADAIEALDGMPVPVRGVECTITIAAVPGGRAPVAVPTVAGRYCRAYRTLPPLEAFRGSPTEIATVGFRMSERDAIEAIVLGFGSMHAADRFLAGEGTADA